MSSEPAGDEDAVHQEWPVVVCRFDALLAERGMTMTEVSRRTGITMANLSALRNNKVKAIRLTTIAALCTVLHVDPGTLLVVETNEAEA